MKLIKNKKIILILLLLITTFCLSACGSLTASTINNADGSIQEQVTISLNVDEVIQAGYNIEEVKNNIYLKALSEATAMVNSYNAKLHIGSMLISNMQASNDLIDGAEVVKKNWQNNQLTIGVKFKNTECYKFYYNIEENSDPEYIYEHHFLYTKMYFEGYTMFSRHYDLYSRLHNYYLNVYPNLVHHENNQVLYVHVSEKHREHSNANFVFYKDGNYYHAWVLDQSDPNQKITIYYNIANKSNCIWLALVLVVGITLIIFGIVAISNNINKNKKLLIKLIKKHKKH